MNRKRCLTAFTALFLACTSVAPQMSSVSVSAAELSSDAQQAIEQLGLTETDVPMPFAASAKVTRAQFSQILCKLAANPDVTQTGYSLYPDVAKSYWAFPYISSAVSKGYLSGYSNGCFEPESAISYPQALFGILKVLGYSELPENSAALLSFAAQTGLCDGISLNRKADLDVQNLKLLLYNALKMEVNNRVYAENFGFSLGADGELDYASYLSSHVEGPFIASGTYQTEIPFSLSSASLYRNGSSCSVQDLKLYDVLYYSEPLQTVWAYSQKTTGTVTAISPSVFAPDSIELDGQVYRLGTEAMVQEFSVFGSVSVGDVITVLFGSDGTIAGIRRPNEEDSSFALVLSTQTVPEDGNLTSLRYTASVVLSNGTQTTVDYDPGVLSLGSGSFVLITYDKNGASANALPSVSIPAFTEIFHSATNTLGDLHLSQDCRILDVYRTSYSSVTPSRLEDVTLENNDILYLSKNEAGEVKELILNNFTGDLQEYGIVLDLKNSGNNYTLTYLSGNQQQSALLDNLDFSFSLFAPAALALDGSNLVSVKTMDSIPVNQIYSSYLTCGSSNDRFPLANQLPVYYYDNSTGEYTATSLEAAGELSKYLIHGYYDSLPQQGGQIRLLVLQSK